jgi:hypothetical protein
MLSNSAAPLPFKESSSLVYQLAFFTPGKFPASAFKRNMYYNNVSRA